MASQTALTRLALILWMTLAAAAQRPMPEQSAVDKLQRIPASTLEQGLPREPFLNWLNRALGPSGKVNWEVTDCGEQSGDPALDRGRDFPVCVDAVASLPSGHTVIVSVVVGSSQKGTRVIPLLHAVSIGTNGAFDAIGRLRDLPARVKATR